MRHPLGLLRRSLDPRLEWVHDKEIGPDRDSLVDPAWAITWRINRGGATVRSDRGEWRVGPGDWVFLLPARRHQAFAPGTRMWSIAYRFGRPRGAPWYRGPDVLVVRGSRALDRAGIRLVAMVAAEAREHPVSWSFDFPCRPEAWLRIDAAFRLWLATAVTAVAARGVQLTAGGAEDDRVAAALARIDRDPWAAAAEPAALAAAVGLSRRRLEQLFAAALGHGVAEARDRVRVERAQELLGRRELPVKQIATRLGFATSPAFSVWFRRHAGQSPRAFRSGVRPGA